MFFFYRHPISMLEKIHLVLIILDAQHCVAVAGWLGEERKQKNFIVGSTNCCWHFSRVTQTDREYGLMSSSKIGLVKITCHESLHSSHDVEFLHSYQQSYTSTWDKLLSPQCIIQDFLKSYIHTQISQTDSQTIEC